MCHFVHTFVEIQTIIFAKQLFSILLHRLCFAYCTAAIYHPGFFYISQLYYNLITDYAYLYFYLQQLS
jgi:hypothetical protein